MVRTPRATLRVARLQRAGRIPETRRERVLPPPRLAGCESVAATEPKARAVRLWRADDGRLRYVRCLPGNSRWPRLPVLAASPHETQSVQLGGQPLHLPGELFCVNLSTFGGNLSTFGGNLSTFGATGELMHQPVHLHAPAGELFCFNRSTSLLQPVHISASTGPHCLTNPLRFNELQASPSVTLVLP